MKSPMDLWTNPVAVAELLAQWSDSMATEQTNLQRTTSMLQEVVGRQQETNLLESYHINNIRFCIGSKILNILKKIYNFITKLTVHFVVQ